MNRMRGWWIAAAIVLFLAGLTVFFLWRTVRRGELVVPESLAGPDTVALISFDLRRDDPGAAKALARIVDRDEKRKSHRLPAWAWWLLGGGSSSALPLGAAAVLPVRLVLAVDRPAGGEVSGGVVVSLSKYSSRLPEAMGASPDPQVEGLPVVHPSRRGEAWTGIYANNILLSRDAEGLRAIAARLGGRSEPPGALFEALREAVPSGGDGFGIVVNPGDRLERLAHEALARSGVKIAEGEGESVRLLPRDLLGSGFSVDFATAEQARVEGVVLFGDSRAASDGEEWVRRVLPVSLAFVGVESRFTVRREGERLLVSGTIENLGRLWDRLLSGRLLD